MKMRVTVRAEDSMGNKLDKEKFDVDARNVTEGLQQAVDQQKAKFPSKYPPREPQGLRTARQIAASLSPFERGLLKKLDLRMSAARSFKQLESDFFSGPTLIANRSLLAGALDNLKSAGLILCTHVSGNYISTDFGTQVIKHLPFTPYPADSMHKLPEPLSADQARRVFPGSREELAKNKWLLSEIQEIVQKHVGDLVKPDTDEKAAPAIPTIIDAANETDRQRAIVLRAVTRLAYINENLSIPPSLRSTLNDAQRESRRSLSIAKGEAGPTTRTVRDSVEFTENALEDAVTHIRALEKILAQYETVAPRVQRDAQAAVKLLQEHIEASRLAEKKAKMGSYSYAEVFNDRSL